jgi:hypothetical protein
MSLEYTFYKAEDNSVYLGYFKQYPFDIVKGETLEELEERLFRLYQTKIAKFKEGWLEIPDGRRGENRAERVAEL